MRTSPLVSRAAFACYLSIRSLVSAQYLPGASFFDGNGAPSAAPYELVDDYEGTTFFDKFSFYSGYDPTNGHVQYVNQTVAERNGLASTSPEGRTIISVDTTNRYPNGGPGRPAVRLVSNNAYTHGLFILDLVHMPYGCGTWPAYWLLGPDWPSNGEIDIIEGVNTIDHNSMSLHTSNNCTISGAEQSGDFQTSDCNKDVNGNSGCGSSASNTNTPNNYGAALNRANGGVYATEWTSNYIKVWFFGRNNIPTSITIGAPDVSQFGVPVYNAQGQCPIDQHFNNMSIIINTDFCGDWAGNVFTQYAGCPSSPGQNSWGSCVNYVGDNPSAFTEAYWSINSVRVYQMPMGARPSLSYSTSLSSISATASTNTIPRGMGATTSGLSSEAYTGSLSSISSTKSSSSETAASSSTSRTRTRSSTSSTSPAYSSLSQAASFSSSSVASASTSQSGTRSSSSSTSSASSSSSTASPSSSALTTAVMSSSSSAAVSSPSSSTSSSSAAVLSTSSSLADLSTTISSATSSSANPSASAGLQCPASNGTAYTDPSGIRYIVMCDVTTNPGDIGYHGEPDFESCIDACHETDTCIGVNFYFDGGCFFKAEYFSTLPGESVAAAILASLVEPASSTTTTSDSASTPSPAGPCPAIDGQTVTDVNGSNYTIACGSDTTEGSFSEATFTTTDYAHCMTLCDETNECAAWTWVPYPYPGGVCYLKRQGATFVAGTADEIAGTLVVSLPTSRSSAMPSSTARVGASAISYTAGSQIMSSNIKSSSAPATSPGVSATRTSSMAAASTLPCNSAYTDQTGAAYSVRCNTDTTTQAYAISYSTEPNGGFDGCFTSCSLDSRCAGFTFVKGDSGHGETGSCELKSSSGIFVPSTSNRTSCFRLRDTMGNPGYSGSDVSTPMGSVTSMTAGTSGSGLITTGGAATSTSPSTTAPPCRTEASSLCASSDSKSTCSSSSGNNYDVTCGIVYEGTVIDTSGISQSEVKRAIEPTFNDCQSLCDGTTGCVALNYIGTNCTLLSSVTGTSYVPGAIGASISGGTSTADPVCPGSANQVFTDSNGVAYSIGCYTDYAGNNIGNPLNAASFSACAAFCDALSGCYGVEFDTTSNQCTLKSSFSGTQSSNTNLIYGVKNRAATGGTSINPTLTPSTTLCKICPFKLVEMA
ncbi:uncharacterized protein LTR77_003869 [Saxophila tyrrhenica]|uniref:endo-1,3(4)-beta-glucanase n=1 Tax=Saxophila tyrrhenica TaxID=1690608 RepID=A0AAV9PIA9_9PEZI|nr:hypothetical protein LTR77_003869 [Saxophila tyrrhenica]